MEVPPGIIQKLCSDSPWNSQKNHAIKGYPMTKRKPAGIIWHIIWFTMKKHPQWHMCIQIFRHQPLLGSLRFDPTPPRCSNGSSFARWFSRSSNSWAMACFGCLEDPEISSSPFKKINVDHSSDPKALGNQKKVKHKTEIVYNNDCIWLPCF